jgi:cell division protein FtsL
MRYTLSASEKVFYTLLTLIASDMYIPILSLEKWTRIP